jgi:hypothetical protein
LFDDHANYLKKLDKALSITNNDIKSMQAQNDIQQESLEKYKEKTERELRKNLDNMIENEKNNNRKLT